MDRQKRIQVIHENIYYTKNDPNISEYARASIQNQQIIWETENLPIPEGRYSNSVNKYISQDKSIHAAKKYAGKKVCVLNFASFVTPGGGVLRGTTAQEESICRATSLYSSISDESVSRFYSTHKAQIAEGLVGRENSDDCIYTPNVLCFREDSSTNAILSQNDWYEVSVITCAAPDQRHLGGKNEYHPSDEQQLRDFEDRIHRIFAIAAIKEVEILIVGAFGCGVFGNSPRIVSKAFENQLLLFDHHFEVVEFAIFCKNKHDNNYKAFEAIQGISEISENNAHTISDTKISVPSITLPKKWEDISVKAVEETLEYLHQYCGLSERDIGKRSDCLYKRSKRFYGGTGGVCGYKEYKRNLMYIQPYTRHLRYGEVAAALCFIRMQAVNARSTLNDVLSAIHHYKKSWYTNEPIADGDHLFFVHSGYDELLNRLQTAYCESGGNSEIGIVLEVFAALQWNARRIHQIQYYLDNDDL